MARYAALILALLMLGPPLHAAEAYRAMFATDRDGIVFSGDWRDYQGRSFFRNREIGMLFSTDDLLAVYTPEYYARIRTTHPIRAAAESIFLMNAGQRFVWNPGGSTTFFGSDSMSRIAKIGLVTTTAILYLSTQSANRALQGSYPGISDGGARAKFNTQRNYYYGSLSLTIGIFSVQAIAAYLRHGTSSAGADLHIRDIEPRDFGSYAKEQVSIRVLDLKF